VDDLPVVNHRRFAEKTQHELIHEDIQMTDTSLTAERLWVFEPAASVTSNVKQQFQPVTFLGVRGKICCVSVTSVQYTTEMSVQAEYYLSIYSRRQNLPMSDASSLFPAQTGHLAGMFSHRGNYVPATASHAAAHSD
jgi:hypothetical protein